MTSLTFYGGVGETDKKVQEIVEKSIRQAIRNFGENQEKFKNEQQFQEFLYYILADELKKENMLFAKTGNGRDLILLLREKITNKKYKRSNAKKKTHGRLDIAILNSSASNQDFPKNGSDLEKIPLSVGIEIKLNKTDKSWEDEMNHIFKKLNDEITLTAAGRYIIFLSTRAKFKFANGYRKWLNEHPRVKVYSNKNGLESTR